MARNLDISLLRAFTAAADQRSMTAAGQVLHVTQGAISQQIARLESLVGGTLLIRDRRGLRPTPSGERLLGKARRLLALNDEIWTDLNGGKVEGKLRLGIPYDLVAGCVAPILKSYASAYPEVELSLECGASEELAQHIAAGRLDVALLEQPIAAVTGEVLVADRLVWIGAPGGAAYLREPLPISMVAESCAFRPVVLAALQRQERDWRTMFENGSLEATLAMVRMDLAVSAWLAMVAPPDLEILPGGSGLPDLPAFAITLHEQAGPASPARAMLAQYLRNALARPRQA